MAILYEEFLEIYTDNSDLKEMIIKVKIFPAYDYVHGKIIFIIKTTLLRMVSKRK